MDIWLVSAYSKINDNNHGILDTEKIDVQYKNTHFL